MTWSRPAIHAIDGLLAVAAASVAAILVSGGAIFHIGAHRVDAIHATNAALFLLLLGAPRMVLATGVPLLGIPGLDPKSLSAKCLEACRRIHARMGALDPLSARRLVLGLVILSGLIKLLNAWHYYGFVTGDDVEIQEMTLAKLLGWKDYRAWDLRNAFYPMTFVYPIQALAHRVGFASEAALVFVGRLPVVFLSLATLILVYASARLYYRSIPVAICAVAFLAGSKLHTTYGSSELPRSAAAFFVVLGFWLLARKHPRPLPTALSGIALGIGASLRFSEAIFLAVAALYLVWTERPLRAVVLAVTSAATLCAVVAISDLLYWGKPFYSLGNLIQFTLVDGLSTRGYQPFHHYLTSAGSWTNYLFLALVVYAIRLRQFELALWGLLPIGVLSLLPHKEARYLVPAMPFLSMLAGFAAWHALETLNRRRDDQTSPHLRRRAAVLATVVCGSFLFEADGMRFRRSESSVDIARYLRAQPGVTAVAIQNLWTAGGRVYLWPIGKVLEASPDGRADPAFIEELVESSGVQFLSLRAREIEGEEWARLFERLGFEEVEVGSSVSYNRYRLFGRRGRPRLISRNRPSDSSYSRAK